MTPPQDIVTPAYVYDLEQLHRDLDVVAGACGKHGCRQLYPLKTNALRPLLQELKPVVDGFSVSSPNEARLARAVGGRPGEVHFTSPGLTAPMLGELLPQVDCVYCNSMAQLDALLAASPAPEQVGLRVNPQLSFVDEEAYDPCRRHSKLGLPLDELAVLLARDDARLQQVDSVLMHFTSESTDFGPLLTAVSHLAEHARPLLRHVSRVNVGGGFLFEDRDGFRALGEAVQALKGGFGVQVFMEPGTAVVADCCRLHSTVIDSFHSQGEQVCVLDTTVNHLPEVLEFDYCPQLVEATADGAHACTLAGSSCLAGDIFGRYRFDRPLTVGSTVRFAGCGCYSLVKAHLFNGIHLPRLYVLPRTQPRLPAMVREPSYEDYASRFG